MEKIKKDIQEIEYLLKGVIERISLLNTEFDKREMRFALKEWFNSLEKAIKSFQKLINNL